MSDKLTPKQEATDKFLKDAETGRFVAGTSGAGRKKGSRNKLGEAFLTDMLADWEENGPEAIAVVRAEKPDQYLKVVASILPKDFNVNVNSLEEVTDDELIQSIRELDSAIRPFLDVTGTGADDKGITEKTEH